MYRALCGRAFCNVIFCMRCITLKINSLYKKCSRIFLEFKYKTRQVPFKMFDFNKSSIFRFFKCTFF